MATFDSASSSSIATTVGSSRYDVFLSFRGEDTRYNFISFLYKALKDAGIDAFLDNENLWTGEAIGPTLRRAIEGSKISIPVFSKGYANSKWCLRELAQIFQSYKSNGQIVLPIFFHIEPSQVRNQIGSFEEAFNEHEQIFEADITKSWREALREFGNLKGEVLNETMNPAELIDSVVKRALSELISSTHLAECKYRIDLDSRVNDLLSLLNIGSDDVLFVGICGFGGIGKTTIAKAVYNSIFPTFNRHCFLSDIRERATQCMGIVSLQKQLLKDIFKRDFDIGDFHRGKKLIEERVCKEKVFLVLDDVDSREQIAALAGGLNWFGEGSRVIITTRDEGILNVAKVSTNKIYRPQLLDHENSLQLFSWHAFRSNQPSEEYMQLSRDAAIHSGGLPLTLEVFGSYLSDLRDKEEWESTLQTLKEIPPIEVQRRLKISYDNLENNYQQAIFLDAACFFIGWKKETLISIWEGCGYHPKSALCKLVKRSLLKFEHRWNGECLTMHDHIRDMGREIVLEKSRMEPGKRSRLWSYGEIMEVLETHKGTDVIEGISLPYHLRMPIKFTSEPVEMMPIKFTSEPFEMMPNLRFLSISSANVVGDFSHFPSALRCLQLNYPTLRTLPTNFYHKSLVYLSLSKSHVFEHVWNIRPQDENKRFQNLKVLDLSGGECLSKSPNFSWFPYLEQLDLECCTCLDELDESIGQLNKLKYLILRGCRSLKKLPNSIGDLISLIKMDLTKTKIEELPINISRMGSLKELILSSCNSLKKLPESIGDLKSLVNLDLFCTKIEELPHSISRMSSLKELFLTWCKSFKKLPESIGDLKSLVRLNMSGTVIEELPDSISRMSSLKELILDSCYSLKKLADGVELLEKLELLSLSGCPELVLPRSMGGMTCLDSIHLNRMNITKFPDDFLMPQNLVKLEINQLIRLESLQVDMSTLKTLKQLKIGQCQKLEYILELPSSLVELCCENCDSLVRLPDVSKLKILITVKLRYCKKLEEIQGLGGTESLEELDAQGCYSLTHSPRKIQGTLLTDNKSLGLSYSYSLTASDRIYNNGFILCLVLEFFLPTSYIPDIIVEISTCIHKKDKKIRCLHSLRIKDIEYASERDTIYIHRFKGFDWFGVPLQENDAIEILNIRTLCATVKFCEILFKNREPGQKKPDLSALMVEDFFNWSYMYDDGGVVTLNYWPNQQEIVGDEEELLRHCRRPRLHDHNDDE